MGFTQAEGLTLKFARVATSRCRAFNGLKTARHAFTAIWGTVLFVAESATLIGTLWHPIAILAWVEAALFTAGADTSLAAIAP
jgi:hypothetical protein